MNRLQRRRSYCDKSSKLNRKFRHKRVRTVNRGFTTRTARPTQSVPALLKRLWLPLIVTDARCGVLNASGQHRTACPRSGRLRPDLSQRSAHRVCREAGATVRCNAKLRDMNVSVQPLMDSIEVLASDLEKNHGAQLAVDITLRSALTANRRACDCGRASAQETKSSFLRAIGASGTVEPGGHRSSKERTRAAPQPSVFYRFSAKEVVPHALCVQPCILRVFDLSCRRSVERH